MKKPYMFREFDKSSRYIPSRVFERFVSIMSYRVPLTITDIEGMAKKHYFQGYQLYPIFKRCHLRSPRNVTKGRVSYIYRGTMHGAFRLDPLPTCEFCGCNIIKSWLFVLTKNLPTGIIDRCEKCIKYGTKNEMLMDECEEVRRLIVTSKNTIKRIVKESNQKTTGGNNG